MRKSVTSLITILTTSAILTGCGSPHASNSGTPPDSIVTSTQKYNFQSFSGTTWKTKTKTQLAGLKSYKGVIHVTLLPPDCFDSKHSNYRRLANVVKVHNEFPTGTRIRIDRLLKDNGKWGGVWVTACLDDGQSIYVESSFLEENAFLFPGSDSLDWKVNPTLLEKSE